MAADEGARPSWAEAALSQSGDLFSHVLGASTDSVAINRLEDSVFLYVNDVVVEHTGYSREELVGHRPDEYDMFVDPEWQSKLAQALAAKHSVGGLEGSFRSKSGDLRWAEVSAQLIDLGGEPAVLSVSHDITDRRRAELELAGRDAILEAVAFAAERFLEGREWEKAVEEVLCRLGEAAGSSSAYVAQSHEREDGDLLISTRFEWVADGEPRYRDENQNFPLSEGFMRWKDTLGTGGVISGNVKDFPASERDQMLPDTVSIASVPIFVGEAWWGYLGLAERHRERDWSPVEIEALRAAAGTLGAAIHQRETEERLRETELTHRSLLERMPAVVYLEDIGEDFRDLYLSPQFEDWFGVTVEEALADPNIWWRLIYPDDLPRVRAESHRTNDAREPYRSEYRMIGTSGRTLWVHDEAVLVYDEDEGGDPLYWLGMLTDITALKQAESDRQIAEDRFRTLVEHVPAISYQEVVGASGYPDASDIYLSPQLTTILGYNADDFAGNPDMYWQTILHPDDRERVLSKSVDVTESLEPYVDEYRVVAADGRVLWFHEDARLIRLEDTGEQLWQGVMLDITDRKRVEEELESRDAILEAVAFAAGRLMDARSWEDCIGEVLAHLGRSAGVSTAYLYENTTRANGELAMSLRYEWDAPGVPSGLNNPKEQDFLYSHGFERWEQVLGSGQALWGTVSEFEGAVLEDLRSDGTLSTAAVPIFVNGAWWGYLGFDDNEREREWSHGVIEALRAAAGTIGAAIQRRIVERRLSDAEDKHRRLVEKIPAVLYTDAIDESSTAIYISPQIEELIGYTAEERMKNPRLWIEHLHPEDRAAVLAESERTNRDSRPFAMDYRMIARDGHTVWVRDEAALVRDEAGVPQYWQGVMIDITERKRGEEELARALQLEREAADRLRSLDEMKNTFLTAVSHDLRTPLAAVLGLALTLERDDMQLDLDETRDLARRIASNARKLDRLVMDLLDLDRLSRGILEPKLNRADVGFLVRKVVDEADFLADHPVSVEAEPVVAFVDQAKVERIVENLLANAVRHTPPGTQVWVKVRPADDGGVLITVEDAGLGVLSELREAVFEPFRQVPGTPSSGHSPGVGIGLSLVARFAELHGGRAWVDDRPGGGASFNVRLPDRTDLPEETRSS